MSGEDERVTQRLFEIAILASRKDASGRMPLGTDFDQSRPQCSQQLLTTLSAATAVWGNTDEQRLHGLNGASRISLPQEHLSLAILGFNALPLTCPPPRVSCRLQLETAQDGPECSPRQALSGQGGIQLTLQVASPSVISSRAVRFSRPEPRHASFACKPAGKPNPCANPTDPVGRQDWRTLTGADCDDEGGCSSRRHSQTDC